MRLCVLGLLFPFALTALSLPEWLLPYPGASASNQASPGLIESTYSTKAKPADIVAHYQQQFERAQLSALVNDDGRGTVMRASAAECDLMIRVREQAGATWVTVSCSEKSAASAQATYLPQSPSSAARRPLPRTPAERDAYTAQVLADADARHKQRIDSMSKYDQPVYQDARPRPLPASSGLALEWPSWLVHGRGADRGLSVVKSTDQSRRPYLESVYRTGAPMTEIYNFYEDLFRAHGYRVAVAHLSTGSTLNHVTQNADGDIEGSYSPNGIGNGSIEIKASFSRFYLNEPITVRLRVEVHEPIRLPGR